MFGKGKRERTHLEKLGKRAPATVVEIAAFGWETQRDGDTEEVVRKSTLRVQPDDEPEFEVTLRMRYGSHGRYVPEAGDRIEVLYDREDHEKVMLAPPTQAEEQARAAAALGKADIGFALGGQSGDARAQDPAQLMQQHEQAMAQAQKMLGQYMDMTGASSDEAGTGQPGSDDTVAQLERLQALKESGAITEPEFEKAKANLLGNG